MEKDFYSHLRQMKSQSVRSFVQYGGGLSGPGESVDGERSKDFQYGDEAYFCSASVVFVNEM
jgi:hypothetical protein